MGQMGHHRLAGEVPGDNRPALDAGGGEASDHRVAVGAGLFGEDEGKAEPAAVADLPLEPQPADRRQALGEAPGGVAAPRDQAGQAFQLLDADGPANLRRTDIVAGKNETERFAEITAGILVDQPVGPWQLAGPAVRPQAEEDVMEFLIVGDADAALHGRDVVAEEGAECPDAAEGPGAFPGKARAHRFAIVLDEGDVPPPDQAVDG